MLYINIHNHKPSFPGVWDIQNYFSNFENIIKPGNYSIGLHPWYINTVNWREALKTLEKYSKSEQVLAIGECGLDKACDTDFTLQQQVFTAQVYWANEIKKPLIIHCVRAYEEVLYILKHNNNKVPVIFHGFNKNGMVAAKILLNGHWLSFGKALFQKKNASVFAGMPLEKIFLETDDSDLRIEEIYKQAAAIKNISTEELCLQIKKNIQTVFNTEL